MTSSLPERGGDNFSILERRRLMKAIIWLRTMSFMVVAACCASSLMAQSSATYINMFVSRQPEGGGTYGLEAYWDIVQPSITLTSPDGTIFGSTIDRQFIDVGNLTVSELTSRFAGVWTVNDNWDLPSGATTQQHQFTLTTAQLTTFLPTPTIVSPVENATVPPRFNLELGNGGNGWSIETGFPFEFIFPNPNREIHALLAPGETQREVSLRSNRQTTVVENGTPLSANPAHDFQVLLVQRSQSALRTVTVVVPEPTAMALIGAGVLALAVLRRRM
jgi:hypothetical protein